MGEVSTAVSLPDSPTSAILTVMLTSPLAFSVCRESFVTPVFSVMLNFGDVGSDSAFSAVSVQPGAFVEIRTLSFFPFFVISAVSLSMISIAPSVCINQ